jgi:hypothetical protein
MAIAHNQSGTPSNARIAQIIYTIEAAGRASLITRIG